MKKIIFIISLIYLNTVLADSGITCGPVNALLQNANDVKDVACEEINKKRCEVRTKIDPNSARKRIQGMLDRAESEAQQKSFPANWKKIFKNNPDIEKFFGARDLQAKTKDLPPVPLTQWMGDEKFAMSTKDRAEFKKAFVEKWVAFSQKFRCDPTIESDNDTAVNPPNPDIPAFDSRRLTSDVIMKNLTAMKSKMATEKNTVYVENYLKEIANASLSLTDEKNKKTSDPLKATAMSASTLMVCTTQPDLNGGFPPGRKTIEERYPPCVGTFRKNFENNEWEINSAQLKELLTKDDDTIAVSACINKRLLEGAKYGVKVDHISIKSSASALDNKGKAETKFCAKGFKALSEARAETGKSVLVPGLFSQVDSKLYNLNEFKYKSDPLGKNGDGTSGECPYEYINGMQKLVKPYDTLEGQKTLNENRYVEVHVAFSDSSNSKDEEFLTFQPSYHCRTIHLKCEVKPK